MLDQKYFSESKKNTKLANKNNKIHIQEHTNNKAGGLNKLIFKQHCARCNDQNKESTITMSKIVCLVGNK